MIFLTVVDDSLILILPREGTAIARQTLRLKLKPTHGYLSCNAHSGGLLVPPLRLTIYARTALIGSASPPYRLQNDVHLPKSLVEWGFYVFVRCHHAAEQQLGEELIA